MAEASRDDDMGAEVDQKWLVARWNDAASEWWPCDTDIVCSGYMEVVN